ncbi:MAG: ammonium transporter [Phototrophicaceae bacterium]
MSLSIDALWIIISALLVFMMQAGFLALETGMTRAKNNIDVAMKNIIDFTMSSVIFWLIGFPIMFGFSYLGRIDFLFDLTSDTNLLLTFIFQMMFCGTTVTILSGAIAERTRFKVYVLITILISGLIYPVFGQWVWAVSADGASAGWLGQLGFFDFAGSTVVHSVGGWSALAIAILVGARTGRFTDDGQAVDIPKSNLAYVILGVLLLWFGWFGFNGGSVLQFNETTLSVIFNTLIGGSLGGVTGFLLGIAFNREGDVALILNGVLAGLVSITAGASVISGLGIVITAVVGVFVFFALSELLVRLKIDDVVDAIPVHLGAGIWGTLAVGIFGDLDLIGSGLARPNQILIQLLGIGICGLWTFYTVYGAMSLLNRFMALRVTPEEEYIGLNISEHNARTDLVDLLDVMQDQALNRNFSVRAIADPFTQLGRVANYYNLVMDSLEDAQRALELTNEDLANQVNQVNKANRKLSTANEQVKSFANILSHDLRTPITSVNALVSEIQYELTEIEKTIAQDGELTPYSKDTIADFIPQSLQMIHSAIEQMDKLTKQVLIVAKDESRPYAPIPIEMGAFVQEIVNAQTGVLRDKKIAVTIDPLPNVLADDIMMQQVFTNLFSNAVKYLDPNRAGQIHIAGRTTADAHIFSIQDNGLGIPEDQYDRVFQLFRRVGKHSQIEGNGFGLFYIRNMIQRVDGDIWFESDEGVGTTFYFSIPRQPIVQGI